MYKQPSRVGGGVICPRGTHIAKLAPLVPCPLESREADKSTIGATWLIFWCTGNRAVGIHALTFYDWFSWVDRNNDILAALFTSNILWAGGE